MRRQGSTEDDRPRPHLLFDLPGAEAGPLRKIGFRLAVALGLITLVALITYLGRDGYVDPEDETISLLDAFYYSTVSITTTSSVVSSRASSEAGRTSP